MAEDPGFLFEGCNEAQRDYDYADDAQHAYDHADDAQHEHDHDDDARDTQQEPSIDDAESNTATQQLEPPQEGAGDTPDHSLTQQQHEIDAEVEMQAAIEASLIAERSLEDQRQAREQQEAQQYMAAMEASLIARRELEEMREATEQLEAQQHLDELNSTQPLAELAPDRLQLRREDEEKKSMSAAPAGNEEREELSWAMCTVHCPRDWINNARKARRLREVTCGCRTDSDEKNPADSAMGHTGAALPPKPKRRSTPRRSPRWRSWLQHSNARAEAPHYTMSRGGVMQGSAIPAQVWDAQQTVSQQQNEIDAEAEMQLAIEAALDEVAQRDAERDNDGGLRADDEDPVDSNEQHMGAADCETDNDGSGAPDGNDSSDDKHGTHRH